MELIFLGLLVLLMILALVMGFPVAFALPGSAIIAIASAALCGYFLLGDTSAFFAQDGPVQWLTAGVTNQRSLYWNVERDTLIAIPLFIFMGIMLQRSKIAEDLLIAMAQLFGPIPGGLGISVVFVGALLAATTGIVGATVVAMGMISLPAMMRNNYSKSLATGTICASGTLGQIIPPSIVLIILADQLSSAADQANTTRKEIYKAATGEFSMPAQFDVVSASAGDMFMGAIIPGVILVGIYMLYILILAWFKPSLAPTVPHEGEYDRDFFKQILLALIPPLALIFIVLGSIILGVATVNQAGSIGAIGAIIMAGYRLPSSNRFRYLPAALAIVSIIVLGYLTQNYNLNIRNITSESQWFGIKAALSAVVLLLVAVGWSVYRTYCCNNTLVEVMVETAKTTSMVFIILLGAAMLTTAFRGFGGEELVKHGLTTLPGGFWTQFIVVMLVIFLLGFFLDFIEIAVVVVPIVAPILLANPEANITAVWLGVMIGLNIQTSFLTPPFGFALFYLRGVADKAIKTLDIYKGVSVFIGLQLLGLGIAGTYPSLVNYLPNRAHLLSETAPPPLNPKLQSCLEAYSFDEYKANTAHLDKAIAAAKRLDLNLLPEAVKAQLQNSLDKAEQAPKKIATLQVALADYQMAADVFKPYHVEVRRLERDQHRLRNEIEQLDKHRQDLQYTDGDQSIAIADVVAKIQQVEAQIQQISEQRPEGWQVQKATFDEVRGKLKKARREYNQTVDESYQDLQDVYGLLTSVEPLKTLQQSYDKLFLALDKQDVIEVMTLISEQESALSGITESGDIKKPLTKARRLLKKDQSAAAIEEALGKVLESEGQYLQQLEWREKAALVLQQPLADYDAAIASTIGLRQQPSLTETQAKRIAVCKSHHRDISLNF
jgi:tripartite ATP-independent transporter DctM subunit